MAGRAREKGLIVTYITLACLFSLSLSVQSATATAGWSKTYGGSDYDMARSVVQTNDGGYALAGFTESFGAGGEDFWLVKVDSSGNEMWNKTYGGTEDDDAYCVIRTSDGGYALSGYSNSYGSGEWNYWLVKVDSSGNMQWNKTYPGLGHASMWDGQASSVVQTDDGGYALAGFFPRNEYERDFCLVKVDSSGDVQWNCTYEGPVYNSVFLIRTSDGGYALAGTSGLIGFGFWLIKVDASGNVEWNKVYDRGSLYSAVQASDGGYLLAGDCSLQEISGTQHDFKLVKVDSSGEEMWNKTYGGTEDDAALCVIEANAGGCVMTGYTKSYGEGESDSWLVKTDFSGNMQWNRTYGGMWSDNSNSVIQTLDGGYALVGDFRSYGVPDFWLIKTDDIGIVPEFPSLLTILLFLTLTVLTILVTKRKWRAQLN